MIAARGFLARLLRDRNGTSVLELALGLPLLLALGGYGVETCNLAMANLRISQIALQLADNASRIGSMNKGSAVYQLREGDLNDVLNGARMLGAGLKLTSYGRVTVSSLENLKRQDYSDHADDSAAVQRIHWQRCIGKGLENPDGTRQAGYGSTYGSTTVTAGVDATYANRGTDSAGMGYAPVVVAPVGTSAIFVEVNYKYQPLFGTLYVTPPKLHYVATALVRDKRDFSRIFNPTPSAGTPVPVASTCDKYST